MNVSTFRFWRYLTEISKSCVLFSLLAGEVENKYHNCKRTQARNKKYRGLSSGFLMLLFQPTRRLFGKGEMSLSLFRCNANVAVVLSL